MRCVERFTSIWTVACAVVSAPNHAPTANPNAVTFRMTISNLWRRFVRPRTGRWPRLDEGNAKSGAFGVGMNGREGNSVNGRSRSAHAAARQPARRNRRHDTVLPEFPRQGAVMANIAKRTFSLPPEQAAFIVARVASDSWASAREAVRAGGLAPRNSDAQGRPWRISFRAFTVIGGL